MQNETSPSIAFAKENMIIKSDTEPQNEGTSSSVQSKPDVNEHPDLYPPDPEVEHTNNGNIDPVGSLIENKATECKEHSKNCNQETERAECKEHNKNSQLETYPSEYKDHNKNSHLNTEHANCEEHNRNSHLGSGKPAEGKGQSETPHLEIPPAEGKGHNKNPHLGTEPAEGKEHSENSHLETEPAENKEHNTNSEEYNKNSYTENEPSEYKEHNKHSHLETESTDEKETKYLSLEKSDVKQPTNNSNSSLISPENEDSDCLSVTQENISASGKTSEELQSSDTETLPGKTDTPPNVFSPKGKICDHNRQVCEPKETAQVTNAETPTPAQRHLWVATNKKYIQKEGYRLGIHPGTFYSSNEGYFVEVPNGINYEIILTNENPVLCNVDVFIDNSQVPAISFRLHPGKPMKFDGPTFCDNKFVFLRSKDAPSQSGINPKNTNNGIVQALFTPQKVQTLRTRAVSEPTTFSKGFSNALEILGIEEKAPRKLRSHTAGSSRAERGIDLSNFCQGATALRGEQTTKMYKKADSIEVDEQRSVLIRLRLIARTDDPSVLNEEDICSMYPPSVEELLKS